MKTKEKKIVNENKKNSNETKLNVVKIIVMLIFFTYLIYMFVNLIYKPVNKITIVQGKISDEQSAIGYVIRDEKIIDTNMVSDIKLTKTEGSRVSKNEIIGTYFSKTNQQWETKIQELDVRIQSIMKEQNDIYNNDTKKLEKQIEELSLKMNNTNSLQEILQYKEEINTLLEKKAKITGELSSSGSNLKSLIEERNSYEKKLNESTDYIRSSVSGVISTRIDDLENIFTIESLEKTTYNQFEGYKIRTDELVSNSTKAIKVIDNYYCYLVTHIDDAHKDNLNVGDKLKIRLNYDGAEKTNAVIDKIIDEDNGKTIFLKITNNVEKLIGYRKVSFDIIWWEYEGLKVPNSCITGQDNNATVTLLKYAKQEVVRVKVLKQNENYSIIDNLDDEDIKSLGLTNSDIGRNITIYDELIINK